MKVTKEDQQSINSFSKYYLKKHELDSLIKAKKDLHLQNEDALVELEMMDGKVGTRFGICFFNIESKWWVMQLRTRLSSLRGII